ATASFWVGSFDCIFATLPEPEPDVNNQLVRLEVTQMGIVVEQVSRNVHLAPTFERIPIAHSIAEQVPNGFPKIKELLGAFFLAKGDDLLHLSPVWLRANHPHQSVQKIKCPQS